MSLSRSVNVALLATELRNQVTRELMRATSAAGAAARIFQLDAKIDDIRQIDQALKVTAVLEGSVQEVQGKIRIFSMLVRPSDACGMWANTYNHHKSGFSPYTPRAIAEDVVAVLSTDGRRVSAAA